ncbi:MAG: FtsW/RodA/SpoVE family cell cycle protein, partial [Longicatena sp.]
ENIGMVIGLLPITGVTLPLLSYGGSSLLSYLLALGIVMNTSSQAKKLSDYVYK